MNDESREELAALHALQILEEQNQHALREEMAANPATAGLVKELEDTAAELAHLVPPLIPPAEVKERLMAHVRARSVSVLPMTTSGGKNRNATIGWGLAAALALGWVWQWTERDQLSRQMLTLKNSEAEARLALDIAQKGQRDLKTQVAEAQHQIASLTQEVEVLMKKNFRSEMQIATLQTTVEAYKQGVAVVVWDSEKHEGTLKLEKMPPVETGKDYQLWVVDPKNPSPVNAGVVRVDAQGFAKIDFKPVDAVSEAAKFALSVEKEGGSLKNEGPIILIGP